MNNIPSEHAEQVTFVNWFRLQYPKLLLFAIPNGEYRDPRTASRLKQEGVVPGIADLCCPIHDGKAIWIEMKKSKGGTVSKDQKAIHAYLESNGHIVIIGRGWEDAKNKFIEAYNLISY